VNKRTAVAIKNGPTLFVLERITSAAERNNFSCSIPEYDEYLKNESIKAQDELIAITWLLYGRKSGGIAAYMSLINDAIRLNSTEKELHRLSYPFKTIPAMKIAKLAVSTGFRQEYSGIGSYMLYLASGIAGGINEKSACRFITVDADIEHDPKVTAFYFKNGFLPNSGLNAKRGKTISMRKDIYRK
jgi:hypothetical protein